jgi:hypothetical protein
LNQAGIDILRVDESVLVENVMLRASSNEPDVLSLDQDAATTEHIDLRFIRIAVQLMISSPQPNVLKKP